MRCFVGIIFAACAVLAALTSLNAEAEAAKAQSRFALVIGNSVYQHAPALKEVHGDASAFADALRRLDFNVTIVEDATLEDYYFNLGAPRETPTLQALCYACRYYASSFSKF